MTADEIRAAIAGIVAEEKAIMEAIKNIPEYIPIADYRLAKKNLQARGVAKKSQREHLERLLKERTE